MKLNRLAMLTLFLMPWTSLAGVTWTFSARQAPLHLDCSGAYETESQPGRPELYGARFQAGRLSFQASHSKEIDLVDDVAIEASFCAWAVDRYRTILWKGDRTTHPQQVQYYVSVFNGKLEFKYKKADGSWVVHMTRDALILPQVWYRIRICFREGYPSFWINGTEYPSADQRRERGGAGKLVSNDKPLVIGNGHNGSTLDYHFDGIIREVAIGRANENLLADHGLSRLMADGYAYVDEKVHEDLKALESEIGQLPAPESSRQTAEDIKHEAEQFLSCLKDNRLVEASRAYRSFRGAYHQLRRSHATCLAAIDNRRCHQSLLGGEEFGIATLPTGQGYKRGTAIGPLLDSEGEVSRSAACGEVESFQLLVIGGEQAGTATLRSSPLTDVKGNRLPTGTLSWGLVEDIRVADTMLESSSEAGDRYVGSWPDLIRDGNPSAIPYRPGRPTFVFIRLSVPAHAVPGDYTSVISLSSSHTTRRLSLKLRVWPFAIPARNSLPVVFSFFNHFYQRWYGLKGLSPAQLDRINRFLLAYRISPNNIYAQDIYPSIEDQKAYDLSFATTGYFFIRKPLTEAKLTELIERHRPGLKALQAAGLEQHAYLYAFDEIVTMYPAEQRSTFAAARQVMTRFKQEFPWLKRLQTSVPRQDLQDAFDVWCPLFNYFAPGHGEASRQRERGTAFWWYAADGPCKPYPNFFLGYPLTDLRVIMTLGYQYGIKGILYWCVNREWDTNRPQRRAFEQDSSVWKPYLINVFTKRAVKRNGMGNLTYPGPDGAILPSLRLENLRDGIEDYELYTLLERQLAKLRQLDSPAARQLLKEAQAVLAVPQEVAVDITRYSEAPQPLMRHHDRVGTMIARIHLFLRNR